MILLFAAANVVLCQTQQPITVGILKFQSHFIMLSKDVISLVTGNLSSDPRLSFVERAQLEKVLGEEALGASGIISPESAARIGQLTGAKVLVTGRVLLLKKTEVVILANIIGTETGRMFSQTEQGSRSNLVALTTDLSRKNRANHRGSIHEFHGQHGDVARTAHCGNHRENKRRQTSIRVNQGG